MQINIKQNVKGDNCLSILLSKFNIQLVDKVLILIQSEIDLQYAISMKVFNCYIIYFII